MSRQSAVSQSHGAGLALSMNRRHASRALFALFLPLSACEAKSMSVSLEVVLFSYLDRPIFDVLINGSDIGVSNAYPTTGGGSLSGLSFKPGPLKVSWRFTDTGETVQSKNSPVLQSAERKHHFMAVHVLPDNTVGIALSEHYPDELVRGVATYEARKRHGK